MSIIIEGEIVENNYTEELQDFYGSSFDILAYDISALLIAQIIVFVVAAVYFGDKARNLRKVARCFIF